MARKDSHKAAAIRADIKKWDDQNKYNNTHYHEMTTFILGEQWKEDEAKLFETYRKIPLTVNKIKPLANHLLGEQCQNTPNLQIEPKKNTPLEEAEVRDGLIKDISFNSHAKVQYQTVFEQMAIGGYSAIRGSTQYVDDDSFDQEIIWTAFRDPTKCYWDLGAETPCKTDGMFAGYRTVISRKKFRSLYGKDLEKKIQTITSDITEADNTGVSWSDENSITIIDHFERKSKRTKLFQLSNGVSIREDKLNELNVIEIDGMELLDYEGEPVTIEEERDLTIYRIVHSKWAGDYRLEKAKFPSKQLPVLFADQKSYYDKNGKQICSSFFKDARDSQRYLNYIRTQTAYLIKVSRYDQFMASKQNVKGADTEAIWRDPATIQGALLYDESPNGNKPEQLRAPELSQSLLQQYESAAQDIQVTTGMFDTQMGKQGNEISGDAIDARTRRGSFNTFTIFNALNRVIACLAEITDEMIPEVYDTQREMNLELKSTGRQNVILNEQDDYGAQVKNDMSKGKYKIRLVPGPSREGQKDENAMSMDRIMQKNPETFNAISDLYAENLPFSNAIEIRNRLRATIPPEIIEAGKTGQPIPPKPQQPDPEVMIKIEKLKNDREIAEKDYMIKMQELQMKEKDMEMKAHIEGANFSKEIHALDIKKAEAASKLQEQEMRYAAEMKRIEADLHQNHTQNVVKILTHQPNHFKAEKDHKQ